MFTDNVSDLKRPYVPVSERLEEPLSYEEFVAADIARGWQRRSVLNGMTILQYPRAIMIGCSHGDCVVIRQRGTNIEAYLQEALQELDRVA